MSEGRGPLARLRRWLLLEGNRLHVTAVLLVAIYVVIDPVARRTRAAGQFVVEERADRTPPWEREE